MTRASRRLISLSFMAIVALWLPVGVEAQADFRLEEEQRFGSLDGDLVFNRPVDVWEDDERILVLESSPARVVELTPDGLFRREIGQAGEGPGEFSFPWELGVTHGRLWVSDPIGGRLEIFHSDGKLDESVRFQVPADSNGVWAVPRAPMTDSSYLAGPSGTRMGSVIQGLVDHDTFYLTDLGGSVLTEIYERELPATDFYQAEVEGGRFMIGAHPLMERPLVSIFPDGSGFVVVERWSSRTAEPNQYTLLVFNHSGELERDIRVPYDPLPAEGWKDKERAAYEKRVAGDVRHSYDGMVEAWSPRAFYPPVSDVKAGQDGRILIRREKTLSSTVKWQIVSRSGEVEGDLIVPSDLELLNILENHVWAVARDEFDVPYVVKFVVRPVA